MFVSGQRKPRVRKASAPVEGELRQKDERSRDEFGLRAVRIGETRRAVVAAARDVTKMRAVGGCGRRVAMTRPGARCRRARLATEKTSVEERRAGGDPDHEKDDKEPNNDAHGNHSTATAQTAPR